ncbi:MAG: hypothetical protein ACYTG0_38035 [Planctomycetota bacterium]
MEADCEWDEEAQTTPGSSANGPGAPSLLLTDVGGAARGSASQSPCPTVHSEPLGSCGYPAAPAKANATPITTMPSRLRRTDTGGAEPG